MRGLRFRAPGGKMLLLAQTSLFNHSCHPNAAVYRHDADREKVQVRVLRDVGEGQEVALCYDSALYHMPTARRRELLRARWGFECGCPRCTGSATPADPLRSSGRSVHHRPSEAVALVHADATACPRCTPRRCVSRP